MGEQEDSFAGPRWDQILPDERGTCNGFASKQVPGFM